VDWNPFQFPHNSNSLHTFAFVNIGNDKRLFIVDSATVNPDSGVTKGGRGDSCAWAQQMRGQKTASPKILY